MKNKMKAILYMALLLFPPNLFAQSQIRGRVTDQSGKPLDAVTITLSKDGKIISQLFSRNGVFGFGPMATTAYQVTASLIGYENLARRVSGGGDTLLLVMKGGVTELKTVLVTSHAPAIEHQTDKTVFNVQNSILAAGGTALDALRKAPGVQATDEGQVSAHNKGATIYVNDKPVQLSGESLAAYLASIPSDNLARIEIIQNPSARYDAQGGAIINIVTKKSKADGFNGSAGGAFTQATAGSYNSSGTFNYRKDKMNIYGGLGLNRKELERNIASYTHYQTPQSYADWQGQRKMRPINKAASYQLGADYEVGKNQFFGVLVNGLYNNRSAESDIVTSVFNNHEPLADSAIHTQTSLKGHTSQYSFNVNYKAKLDTTGTSLNFDVDYVPYRNHGDQWVNSSTQDARGSALSIFSIYTPAYQHVDIWSAKTDYAYHIGKRWSLESGLKYTTIRTDNNFRFYNNEDQPSVYDMLRSSHFTYTENTAAAYTSFHALFGKWSIDGGLRGEQTRTTGNSITLDSVARRNYLKLFPGLSVTYKWSDDHVLRLTSTGVSTARPMFS